METGLGVLGLAPAVFWALSPKEFEAILRGRFGQPGEAGLPSRADLNDLMRLFPDQG